MIIFRHSPDSLAQGVKYVFQTSQASQIANLMTRYCEMAKSTGAPKKYATSTNYV